MIKSFAWIVAAALALGCFPHVSLAQTSKTDPRALEACKKTSSSFVQIADCLPDAHVSVKTLDAFDQIYPPAAQPLKAKCIELNADSVVGAATCVTTAISSAIDLKKSLPDGSTLDDPVFQAVSDDALAAKLTVAEKDAQAVFPDKLLWGGGMYHPYK